MKNAAMGPVMSPQEMMATIERQRKTISNLNDTIDILYGIVRDKGAMLKDMRESNRWMMERLGMTTPSTPANGAPARHGLTVKLNPLYMKGGAS